MRKKNFAHAIDTTFWWIIYALPLIYFLFVFIAYIVACSGLGNAGLVLEWFAVDLAQSGVGSDGRMTWQFDGWNDAIIDGSQAAYYALSLFFDNAPSLRDNNIALAFSEVFYLFGICDYPLVDLLSSCFAWFVYMHIIHVFVDFIVFIPRLCHKWMGKATQED